MATGAKPFVTQPKWHQKTGKTHPREPDVVCFYTMRSDRRPRQTWVIWFGRTHRPTTADRNACGKYESKQSRNVRSLRIESCPRRRPGNPPESHKGTSPQVYVWIILWWWCYGLLHWTNVAQDLHTDLQGSTKYVLLVVLKCNGHKSILFAV